MKAQCNQARLAAPKYTRTSNFAPKPALLEPKNITVLHIRLASQQILSLILGVFWHRIDRRLIFQDVADVAS
jgi:hypothetical protein